MTTKAEKQHMDKVAQLCCCARGCGRPGPSTVHHIDTYMGGGRDHFKTIPLCWPHHLGPQGIDGKRMGKRVWEAKYGTEHEHWIATHQKIYGDGISLTCIASPPGLTEKIAAAIMDGRLSLDKRHKK